MKYLALKACRFSCRDYSAGDLIEDTAIEKKSIGALVAMGFIKKIDLPTPVTPAASCSQRIPEPAQLKSKKKPPKVGDNNAEVDIQS